MSAEPDRLRREVGRCAWGQPGWLPTLKVVVWPALAVHRDRHEKAAAELAGAKSDAKVEAAVAELADATVDAVLDLRSRVGMTYGTDTHVETPNEFAERYREAKEPVEQMHEALRFVPTIPAEIERWIEKAQPDEALSELAFRRVDLEADVTTWKAFQAVALLGPTRLIAARVLPLAAAEAIAAREDLDRLRVKQSAGVPA